MKAIIYVLSSAAILISSVLSASAAPGIDISALTTFTVADLSAAKADADAHSDAFASECYAEAIVEVTAQGGNIALPSVVGVASAFQVARDGVKLGQRGVVIPPALVQACGPLALDVNNDLAKGAANTFTVFGIKF